MKWKLICATFGTDTVWRTDLFHTPAGYQIIYGRLQDE